MSQRGPAERQVYSVGELAEILRAMLEDSLPSIWVQGEVSNFRNPTGHWYFTLKDAGAQIRCAMFKNANFYVKPVPRDGDQVLIRGQVSFYTARGDLQIVAEHLEPAGAGALLRAFEALKKKLAAEGLFDEHLKRAIPAAPRAIGVITSPTGAALQDILTTLRRRYPLGTVHLFPVPVQGDTAPPAIVEALRALPTLAPVDVIILARGGGSIEDLWAFNDERVARAIRACPVPVVVGVGHEIDFTIADFAADLRAPTPTAAAELVGPDLGAWRQRLERHAERLAGLFDGHLRERDLAVGRLAGRLEVNHPGRRLLQQLQRLDELHERLLHARARSAAAQAQSLAFLNQRLRAAQPALRIQAAARQLDQRAESLAGRMQDLLRRRHLRLDQAGAVLRSLNPRAVLERGYAMAFGPDGQLLRDAEQVRAGDALSIALARGTVDARVEQVRAAPLPRTER
ncbi:MAG: exodeoxyribonuclease VII large subunit [Gammaproteobacteria bacterium]|nr:exodeoxyribonuclease VII large subunit [Gammaproteobacteria bacterium]